MEETDAFEDRHAIANAKTKINIFFSLLMSQSAENV